MDNFSLTALVNQHIADSREEKEYKSWRASSLGGCPRSHLYKRLGVEETSPPDERKGRVFEVGDIFHEWIQDIAREKLPDVGVEEELFDKELDLAGRYDLLINTDGKRILIDIKTIHSGAFWHLQKSGLAVKDKFPHYYQQLGAYMTLLKRAGTPVDEGRILLVSKDDLTLKEVTYFLTPELEESVLSEVALLNHHWKERTLPPCKCNQMYLDKDGKANGPKYCNYRTPDDKYKGGFSLTQCCDPALATRKEAVPA